MLSHALNAAEHDSKQEGDKYFTETSKSQMQSLIATGAATVAILTTLSMGRSDAQQVLNYSSLPVLGVFVLSAITKYCRCRHKVNGVAVYGFFRG